MRTYENKAHLATCALRFIHSQAIHSMRAAFIAGDGLGPPPRCSCIKPIAAYERLKRRLALQESRKGDSASHA